MNDIESLTELFMRLPGIGPKQAKRFVYFLLREPSSYKQRLVDGILKLSQAGKQCDQCFRFYTSVDHSQKHCSVCSDSGRDESKLLVVEKELDYDAVEKTGLYNGKYFIMGGLVPLLTDKPSEHVRIRELVARVHELVEGGALKEIIFAFPVTDQGDTTREYVEKTVAQVVGSEHVKRSTLARGLSSGLELEYVDKDTFESAFLRRN